MQEGLIRTYLVLWCHPGVKAAWLLSHFLRYTYFPIQRKNDPYHKACHMCPNPHTLSLVSLVSSQPPKAVKDNSSFVLWGWSCISDASHCCTPAANSINKLEKMHGFVCVSVCAHSGVCAEDNTGVVFRRPPAGVSFLPVWVQSVRSSGLAASMLPAEPSGWLINKLLAWGTIQLLSSLSNLSSLSL